MMQDRPEKTEIKGLSRKKGSGRCGGDRTKKIQLGS